MQTCNICNFTGNPADAKFCIECASKLPVIAYTGATSRLSESIPWQSGYTFQTLASGVYHDVEPHKYVISIVSGEFNPPVGYIEGDSLYVDRNEYYQLLENVHTFQALGERSRRDYDTPIITTWMGYKVKVI